MMPVYRRAIYLLVVSLVLIHGPLASAVSPAPTSGKRGMVVASQADGTRAGLAMLSAGGNAIDAAVAAAFAIAVTQPNSTSIGGGCFVLIRLTDGRVVAIDGRETAPGGATADMYVRPDVPKRASFRGALAVATPGLVAGLARTLELFGTKTLAEVLAPSIRLARDGYPVGPYQARITEAVRQRFSVSDYPETSLIHFPSDAAPFEQGWRLVQKDLARTLSAIAKSGPDAFYRGPIAKRISDEVARRGGLLNEHDLASYTPVVRQPVLGKYRGLSVYSYPPPSSGGVILLEMLNILEGFDLADRGVGSSASYHVIAEAMKLSYADRAFHLGDPDFVQVPVERLTSKRYAVELRERINQNALIVKAPGIAIDDGGTAHLSVTDRWGNAVAITQTLNTPWGSGITVPGTGILLNNEMDDFSKQVGVPNEWGLVDQRGLNTIKPGKRPLSSMTPTILVKDGKTFMVTGSAGGARIITSTLLTILNVVDYGMSVTAAVSAPRIHHQWSPAALSYESEIPADVVEGLRRRGHTLKSGRRLGFADAIVIDEVKGRHYGGSDPRRDGLALGF